MAPRPKWWHTLQGSKCEALLAVDLYNRAASERSLEGFVVHMHMAWLYLIHAKLTNDKIDFRYKKSNGRLERVDGDVKTWDLARCVVAAIPDNNDPVRCNVEFFIRLRNKIEHRHEKVLAAVLAGKVQAHVRNYEATLTDWFGAAEGIGDELRFPVFLSSLTPDAVDALKDAYRKLPKRISEFITEYDNALPDEVQGDTRYDFRVLLIPQTGPKSSADAVITFVHEDDLTDEQRKALEGLVTVTRERKRPVQNLGRYKAGQVAEKIEEALGVKFSASNHHARAWRHFRVRPPTGSARPERTDERYCVWDQPHGDYLYTEAWVKKLTKALKKPAKFEEIVGAAPMPVGG